MSTEPNQSSRWLVTTDWLAARLGTPGLVVIDASYYIPTTKRDAAAEYLAGHIAGAVRFDIEAIADHSNALPHMLPAADQFGREVGALGIDDQDTIVITEGGQEVYRKPLVQVRARGLTTMLAMDVSGSMERKSQRGKKPRQHGDIDHPALRGERIRGVDGDGECEANRRRAPLPKFWDEHTRQEALADCHDDADRCKRCADCGF